MYLSIPIMIYSTRYPNNNDFTPDYTTASDESFGRMERQSSVGSDTYDQDEFEEEEFDGESSGTMRYNDAGTNQSNTYNNHNRSRYI